MLLHLVLDVLQVRTQWLSPHPLNPCLRLIQPVCELLQLLVLQVHQDLVESKRERQLHVDTSGIAIIKNSVLLKDSSEGQKVCLNMPMPQAVTTSDLISQKN